MKTEYTIQNFIEDTLKITSETSDESILLSKLSPLVVRAAAGLQWLKEDMYFADPDVGFGTTLLHSEADNSLFVVVDSWLPGRGVRPHEHGTWAVVVGVTGQEKNTFWERVDDGSITGHAELRKLEEHRISTGEVVTMRTGEIHSVVNDSEEMTLTFHVYGRHLNHTGRSQFDVENNLEIPFILEMR